jgi:hypothetical protein
MYATNIAPTFECHFTVLSVRFVLQGYWRHCVQGHKLSTSSSEALFSSCYLDIPFGSSTTSPSAGWMRLLTVTYKCGKKNVLQQREWLADGLIYNAAVQTELLLYGTCSVCCELTFVTAFISDVGRYCEHYR